jgi:hypothetical protein
MCSYGRGERTAVPGKERAGRGIKTGAFHAGNEC